VPAPDEGTARKMMISHEQKDKYQVTISRLVREGEWKAREHEAEVGRAKGCSSLVRVQRHLLAKWQ